MIALNYKLLVYEIGTVSSFADVVNAYRVIVSKYWENREELFWWFNKLTDDQLKKLRLRKSYIDNESILIDMNPEKLAKAVIYRVRETETSVYRFRSSIH